MKKYKANSLVLDDNVRNATTDGQFIQLPSGNTHYKVEGDGKDWVVLTHGYATPYFIYDKIAEGLVKEGYKVLRYDLYGRGLSERVKAKYDPTFFATQLDELTSIIIGDEPFYLFGTSMGGIITTTFIAKRPEKVKKLVLLAPAGMVFKTPLYMKIARLPLLGGIFSLFSAPILTKGCASEMIYSGVAAKDNYTEQFAYYTQYKGMPQAVLSSLRHTILNFKENLKGYEGTRESKVPVLVIWGTADKTMPYYQSERMKEVLPDMTLITYEGSGHIFLYDEGDRTLNDAIPFLKK